MILLRNSSSEKYFIEISHEDGHKKFCEIKMITPDNEEKNLKTKFFEGRILGNEKDFLSNGYPTRLDRAIMFPPADKNRHNVEDRPRGEK
jgi:hypothetical protein